MWHVVRVTDCASPATLEKQLNAITALKGTVFALLPMSSIQTINGSFMVIDVVYSTSDVVVVK